MYKVLIVEDDINLRSNLVDILTAENFSVTSASNGEEGFKKAKSFMPDLIISDILMPNVDGFQFFEKIKNDNDLKTVPFIFLTAKTDNENLRKAMRMGADDYLHKPFEIDELLDVVNTRIEKSKFIENKIEDLKESLVRKIPHEFRTPLVAILGYTEILEEEFQILSKDEIQDYLAKIKISIKKLRRRIDKFILYSELLHNGLEKTKNINKKIITNFNEQFVSQLIISKFNESIKDFSFNIDVLSAEIFIDPDDLQIILTELFENVFKYANPNSNVTFFGYFAINDYIIGTKNFIKPDEKITSSIISPLKNLNQNKFSEEGVGLGLAIAKKILEKYGGEIYLRTKENQFETIIKLKYGQVK